VIVGVLNLWLSGWLAQRYSGTIDFAAWGNGGLSHTRNLARDGNLGGGSGAGGSDRFCPSLAAHFAAIRAAASASVHDPLVNVAVTTNILAGITGSASGGMSIALAAMAGNYVRQAAAAGIPNEVMHRVAAMSAGGMDTLPHNGAIITLLAITGLTHRESYRDIFVLTFPKIAAAFLVIGAFRLFQIV
jgi:hypothetical protein